ncbi:MAG TPA: hypothetical protein VI094_15405 [Propionibacteriaceae bacterium]
MQVPNYLDEVAEGPDKPVQPPHNEPVTGPDIAKRAEPVDAGVGPEIDKNYLAAQVRRPQRRGIEPASVAVEARHVTLDG